MLTITLIFDFDLIRFLLLTFSPWLKKGAIFLKYKKNLEGSGGKSKTTALWNRNYFLRFRF
jgi:hypothetical protein